MTVLLLPLEYGFILAIFKHKTGSDKSKVSVVCPYNAARPLHSLASINLCSNFYSIHKVHHRPKGVSDEVLGF